MSRKAAAGGDPILSVENLCKDFIAGGRGLLSKPRHIRAVDDASFNIARGETLGLVGESGCGKTTTGRLILRLLEPTSGRVTFDENDVLTLAPDAMRAMRHRMQIIFGFGEPFHRGHSRAFSTGGQHGARFYRLTVHMHNTGAALAGVTAHMGPGQS